MNNFSKLDKQAYKYALLSVFLWSTVATAFKFSLKYLSPEALLLYASISSLFVLFIIILIQKKLALTFSYIKKNYLNILLLGSINPFLYYLVLFEAYDLLPAQEAQAINYTWVLMFAFLSVPFLKYKLRFVDIIAGIICYFGVLIIATKGEPFSLSFTNIQGVFLALFSTIIWSLFWIFKTKKEGDSVILLFSNFLFASPMIFIYFIFTNPIEIPKLEGLLGAVYVGFFEMGITFLFWLKAVQSTSNASKIANLIFISPFLSFVFIYFILKEPIYISTLMGFLFIIIGLGIQKK